MVLYEQIQRAVLYGKPRLVEKKIKEALESGLQAAEILEKGLLPSLDSIEKNLCESEEQITQSLSCARAMKKGIECLEKELGAELCNREETVLIGTASGDLHDMGKNIVALYFRSAGFRVIDLGVDVSADQFLKALDEHPEVGVVCVSSLLKTSLPAVRHIVQSIHSVFRHRDIFVMIGGGSLTAELAIEYGADCYTETAVRAVQAVRAHLKDKNTGI